jgi:UDP-3-O-[3-hydroxymyristoyl] N-acetylglucosamine deacetylase
MLKIFQSTLPQSIKFEGIGLHTGKKSKILVHPSTDDTGIVFKRTDLEKNNIIKASYKSVKSARLCTKIENEFGVGVSTVEHLLAALFIADIDNAFIEIDAEEVPIMDGSAKDFLNSFRKFKNKTLKKKRKYLKVLNKIELNDGDRRISIEPSENLEVDFQLDYKNKIIGKQRNIVNFNIDDLEEVTNSRTFCLYEDIEKIKKIGLAKGGSLENAIVVDRDKILNEGGLRNEKEFVNHKILDLVGDVLLSEHRVLGKITCSQGGHELTNMFLRKLLNSKSSINSVELSNIEISKKVSSNQPDKIAINA